MRAGRAGDDDVAAWHDDGWVLIEGLVPVDEIDAAAVDLREMFPSAEEYHTAERYPNLDLTPWRAVR
jgi:hypothetical protein